MLSKNIEKLQELSKNAYFTLDDVAQTFGLQQDSARVFCSRYVKKGLLVRLKNNLYTTSWKWENLTRDDFFIIANIMQVPSYISLMSALAYYEVTTRRGGLIEAWAGGIVYNIRQADGCMKVSGHITTALSKLTVFIATKKRPGCGLPVFIGKYRFDADSLDLKKLDFNKLKKMIKNYPQKTKDTVKRLCRI